MGGKTPQFVAIGCCVLVVFGAIFAGVFGVYAIAYYFFGGDSSDSSSATTACGPADLEGAKKIIPVMTGKLGFEEHLLIDMNDWEDCLTGPHFEGLNSSPLTPAGGCGYVRPHTTDQEHWYFNTRWLGLDWTTYTWIDRDLFISSYHKKIIIRGVKSGLSMIVSAEESGPAIFVTNRDGIWYGAPPEVYKYIIPGENPYTSNPDDEIGQIEILGLAPDDAKLGPCN